MFIVDAHLDLAYNALRGRDVLRSAVHQVPDNEGTPSVGLPDLQSGEVGLVCGTIFCEPASRNAEKGYRTPDEAAAMALQQLRWYEKVEQQGHIDLVRHRHDVPSAKPIGRGTAVHLILLMEGADPLRNEIDVQEWYDAGLRMVGLAWKRTRLAGGTGAPGPLTPEGVRLLATLDRHGLIHDLSHLAEESFWQLLDLSDGPVVATHSNCRTFIPTDRHLSDEMIMAIAKRGGVVGINFYEQFLVPPTEQGQRRATLDDVVLHIRHVCDVTGRCDFVGLGTDMDGGFGRERIPAEINTSADLPILADKLAASGFDDEQITRILGENWVRFFEMHLPSRLGE